MTVRYQLLTGTQQGIQSSHHKKIRAVTNIASSYVKVLMCLSVLPSLSPSLLESYKHLNIFCGAQEKDKAATVVPRSWDMALFTMLWAVLGGRCNEAPGLLETSHNLQRTPLC